MKVIIEADRTVEVETEAATHSEVVIAYLLIEEADLAIIALVEDQNAALLNVSSVTRLGTSNKTVENISDTERWSREKEERSPYRAWRSSSRIDWDLVQPSGVLQYVGSSMGLFAKALTAPYCRVSRLNAATIAISARKIRAARVAVKVSCRVCCKSPCESRGLLAGSTTGKRKK